MKMQNKRNYPTMTMMEHHILHQTKSKIKLEIFLPYKTQKFFLFQYIF